METKLTVKDLMIGDYVMAKKEPIRIATPFGNETVLHQLTLYGYTSDGAKAGPFLETELTPIPLTAEILEKNGFKYYNYGHNDYGWKLGEDETFVLHKRYNSDEYEIGVVVEDRESYYLEKYMSIRYVHELQHALRLCGINDKEIVL